MDQDSKIRILAQNQLIFADIISKIIMESSLSGRSKLTLMIETESAEKRLKPILKT